MAKAKAEAEKIVALEFNLKNVRGSDHQIIRHMGDLSLYSQDLTDDDEMLRQQRVQIIRDTLRRSQIVIEEDGKTTDFLTEDVINEVKVKDPLKDINGAYQLLEENLCKKYPQLSQSQARYILSAMTQNGFAGVARVGIQFVAVSIENDKTMLCAQEQLLLKVEINNDMVSVTAGNGGKFYTEDNTEKEEPGFFGYGSNFDYTLSITANLGKPGGYITNPDVKFSFVGNTEFGVKMANDLKSKITDVKEVDSQTALDNYKTLMHEIHPILAAEAAAAAKEKPEGTLKAIEDELSTGKITIKAAAKKLTDEAKVEKLDIAKIIDNIEDNRTKGQRFASSLWFNLNKQFGNKESDVEQKLRQKRTNSRKVNRHYFGR